MNSEFNKILLNLINDNSNANKVVLDNLEGALDSINRTNSTSTNQKGSTYRIRNERIHNKCDHKIKTIDGNKYTLIPYDEHSVKCVRCNAIIPYRIISTYGEFDIDNKEEKKIITDEFFKTSDRAIATAIDLYINNKDNLDIAAYMISQEYLSNARHAIFDHMSKHQEELIKENINFSNMAVGNIQKVVKNMMLYATNDSILVYANALKNLGKYLTMAYGKYEITEDSITRTTYYVLNRMEKLISYKKNVEGQNGK